MAGPLVTTLAIVLLGGAAVGLQVARERLPPLPVPAGGGAIMYLRSPEVVQRAALSFDGLAADLYWLRAIQHYGGTKRSTEEGKSYDQLYPLLDLTTSLDPRFTIAYRFGAVYLSEPFPTGAGRPDLAVTLLQKGLRADPERWEYAQDIGFVHYWWRRDYAAAAEWFLRAGSIPGAPNWLKPLAAVTLSQGGNRTSSRRLWEEVLASAEVDWLRSSAVLRLGQLDALDRIDALGELLNRYERRFGTRAHGWPDLIRSGEIPGFPIDAQGHPFVLDPDGARIHLDPASPLNPLPVEPLAAAPIP